MSDDEQLVRERLRALADGIEPVGDLPAVGRARYRRRVRRQRASLVIGSVVLVLAIIGVAVSVTRQPARTLHFSAPRPTSGGGTAEAPPPTVSAPKPRTHYGHQIVDTTWISADTGWALVQSAVLQTTDGGRTWIKESNAPAPVVRGMPNGNPYNGDDCGERCISRIRFADDRRGWLFGGAFYETDDGGTTWTRIASRPVVAFEIAHGVDFRVVTARDGCPPGCSYLVETSKLGSNVWRRLATPALYGDGVQLLYEGPRLYVAAYGNPAGGADAQIHLIRSVDSGSTWQVRADPCGMTRDGENDTASLAAAPGGFLVALCQARAGRGAPFVRASTDAGTTFSPPRALPAGFDARAGAIAAGSPDAIMAVGVNGPKWALIRSYDRGVTWRTTLVGAPSSSFEVRFLGFENAHTGRVAVNGDRLWTTRDGGDTWSVGHP